MDEFLIKLSYRYVSKKCKLTWQEIIFAIQCNIFTPYSAVEHGVSLLLADEEYSGSLCELASLSEEESLLNNGSMVYPLVDDLIASEEKQRLDFIRSKWLYLTLLWVYENKDRYNDPLEIVDEVYADFDYPRSIEAFVTYMYSDESDIENKERTTNHLYEKWSMYLQNQSKIFDGTSGD
ncbi:DUF2247 family protein [Kiloniella laminariae]|uniref:DUF2247 family protein n=1 Tax=Kiloniella laminariae TaxID=454162 RepID=A0ABT4LPU0_9PROT|nr:DUF2247 family protein [Kiloniella laminariae]MCZ4281967.1 DUF2247 family protein [Kiloniella laminariae]